MSERQPSESKNPRSRRRPATTPEQRENQLIALAVDVAEQQMLAGTASAQVISHFLKLGSSREKLEKERIARENELMQAKIEAMAVQKQLVELYEDAISAMRVYGGQSDAEVDNLED